MGIQIGHPDLLKKIGQSGLLLEEKGIITVLESLAPEQIGSLSAQELQNYLPNDRPGTIVRVLRNLEHKGVILREQERDDQGKFSGMHWQINFEQIKMADMPQKKGRRRSAANGYIKE